MKRLMASGLIMAVVMACGGSESYPESVKDNFVNSCVSTSGSARECVCMVGWFEKNVALEDFIAEETRFLSGTMSDRLADWMGKATAGCVS